MLVGEKRPPAKLVLIVPYDELCRVAAGHYPFLPVRLIMRDNWNNVAALASYSGPIDIFAGQHDTVIPVAHAQTLAASRPQAKITIFNGGHNDWAGDLHVRITNP
jgi:pimeloyl-ACP methyl ester carboxylesterase